MTVQTISLSQLFISFIPVFIVILILWKWQLEAGKAVYAMFRMLAQLLLIGYVLVFIFSTDSSWLILGVLFLMIVASSLISLNTCQNKKQIHYIYAFVSILIGGGSSLLVIILWVLNLQPWYVPNYVIPLAGMVFANAMTSISIAIERYEAELSNGSAIDKAKISAFQASMIPVINSLFAVGLVSLPGMMTGQILSGVSPFIAARYQIMVMCMVFSSAGLTTACFLYLINRYHTKQQPS